MNPPPVKLTDL